MSGAATARRLGDIQPTSSRGRHGQPVLIMQQPSVIGPIPDERNPLMVHYRIVAQLLLAAQDADATPSIAIRDVENAEPYLDIRWITNDTREPRGIWERSATITIPRQFAITTLALTGTGR